MKEKLKKTGITILGEFINRPVLICFLVFFMVVSFAMKGFMTPLNMTSLMTQTSYIMIIAFGSTFVILNGGIDFSSTAVIGLGSVLAARIMNTSTGWLNGSQWAVPVAIIVFLAVGVIMGTINGVAVTKLKMPSFIATMTVQLIFGGIALFITQSTTISNMPKIFNKITTTKFGSVVPVCFIAAVFIGVVCEFVLKKTKFGQELYAIGCTPKTAEVSGVPVKKNIFKIFLIAGFMSAVGGLLMMSRMGCGKASLADDALIDYVAAIIIGGTSPSGGTGDIIGTFVGALLISTINLSLNMMGTPWYIITLVKGALLMVMAMVNIFKEKNTAG